MGTDGYRKGRTHPGFDITSVEKGLSTECREPLVKLTTQTRDSCETTDPQLSLVSTESQGLTVGPIETVINETK